MKIQKFPLILIVLSIFSFNVQAQELTMFSGFLDYQYYQDDQRIKKAELVSLMETNTEAFSHWKKSRTFETLSWVALASEVGFFVWEVTDNDDPSNDTATKIGVFGSLAAVITFSVIAHHQKKNAILKYNKSLEKQTAFKIVPSKKGLGIALQF